MQFSVKYRKTNLGRVPYPSLGDTVCVFKASPPEVSIEHIFSYKGHFFYIVSSILYIFLSVINGSLHAVLVNIHTNRCYSLLIAKYTTSLWERFCLRSPSFIILICDEKLTKALFLLVGCQQHWMLLVTHITIDSTGMHDIPLIFLDVQWQAVVKSKVGNLSRRWPEDSLFYSYYTEMYGTALLHSLDCSILFLIRTL